MSIRTPVIVGVYPGQADGIVLEAAVFAARFDAELVCAWVDPCKRNPDAPSTRVPQFNAYLSAHLTRILGGHDIAWSTRHLSGDPARALGQLAESLRAVMIVVGTRDASLRGGLQEFFAGSVAAHLAHRQHRPIVIIPLSPVSLGTRMPWATT